MERAGGGSYLCRSGASATAWAAIIGPPLSLPEQASLSLAIAHKILVAVFHMLQRAVTFAALGADDLDRLDKHRTAKRLVRRLDALG